MDDLEVDIGVREDGGVLLALETIDLKCERRDTPAVLVGSLTASGADPKRMCPRRRCEAARSRDQGKALGLEKPDSGLLANSEGDPYPLDGKWLPLRFYPTN